MLESAGKGWEREAPTQSVSPGVFMSIKVAPST